jgi:carbonic anhydrase
VSVSYRLHRSELDGIKDPEKRHRRLVELNVIEQCINLFKTGAIQRQRVTTYREGQAYVTPRIHACVFDPKTGDLIKLQVNFKEFTRDLHDIYDLYTLDDEYVLNNVPHAPQVPTKSKI